VRLLAGEGGGGRERRRDGGKCVLAPTQDDGAGGFDERAAGGALHFGVGRVPDGVGGAAGRGRVLAEELEAVEEVLRDSCGGGGR